ncbi:hypothetical protein SOCEGT47_055910 [Sorangium cellulosum]|uniref:Uncharacterized protein n=1 Tax=Sorangium cellulosum TaxID=56 RepID=A0A4P2Q7G2_SORCE|nr:hypothetical protein [Sorangium cellulosum]AUX25048.1 hypothetical protein SOCEGT47_055910 [Sorangium cellulosum]
MSFARLGFVPVLGLLPLLGFGCSDPAPPTPRGAFTLSFVGGGSTCNTTGHGANLGVVSQDRKDEVLADGDGAVVECDVSGSGSFSVSGRARDTANAEEIQVTIDGITPQASQAEPATGYISFSSARTGGEVFVSDPDDPCRFWFTPGSQQGVDAGKIWAVFECPRMLNEGYVCSIRGGVLAFDSCGL